MTTDTAAPDLLGLTGADHELAARMLLQIQGELLGLKQYQFINELDDSAPSGLVDDSGDPISIGTQRERLDRRQALWMEMWGEQLEAILAAAERVMARMTVMPG